MNKPFAKVAPLPAQFNGTELSATCRPSEVGRPTVLISPIASLRRRLIRGRGIIAELVQATSRERIEYRYQRISHLLVAWEKGIRSDGETLVDDTRSTLRNVARKLTFVPAGRLYFEWHQQRTATRLMYFYIDAAQTALPSSQAVADMLLAPRVFFEDNELWSTVQKLKGLIEAPPLAHGTTYFEALGAVLIQELARSNCGADSIVTSVRGGLAAWQQRIVADYIEEHLAEQIPLATLASLARLSPYHFSRAFKQSFGVPPHRYHTSRRIEHAKALLEDRTRSVTDIGLSLGFSETSSFTTIFRKSTGVTPRRYHRSVG